jgi:hypothetical protein
VSRTPQEEWRHVQMGRLLVGALGEPFIGVNLAGHEAAESSHPVIRSYLAVYPGNRNVVFVSVAPGQPSAEERAAQVAPGQPSAEERAAQVQDYSLQPGDALGLYVVTVAADPETSRRLEETTDRLMWEEAETDPYLTENQLPIAFVTFGQSASDDVEVMTFWYPVHLAPDRMLRSFKMAVWRTYLEDR